MRKRVESKTRVVMEEETSPHVSGLTGSRVDSRDEHTPIHDEDVQEELAADEIPCEVDLISQEMCIRDEREVVGFEEVVHMGHLLRWISFLRRCF
jgi:hypothetical protein